MNSYTLGLDIGSRSIGWTLIANKKKPSIVGIGVRVFPEGVDRDTKGAEKSKNTTRREARGTRPTHSRRNRRTDMLVKTLRDAKLLPENKQDSQELLKKEPYQFRAKGLDERLGLYEFGRALFHINQRRGFKSNRKASKAEKQNRSRLRDNRYGSYFAGYAKCRCRRTLKVEYSISVEGREIRI